MALGRELAIITDAPCCGISQRQGCLSATPPTRGDVGNTSRCTLWGSRLRRVLVRRQARSTTIRFLWSLVYRPRNCTTNGLRTRLRHCGAAEIKTKATGQASQILSQRNVRFRAKQCGCCPRWSGSVAGDHLSLSAAESLLGPSLVAVAHISPPGDIPADVVAS